MSLAVVTSRALDGLDAPEVQVEVQLANGLPSFTLVGLADTEVKESRERVRAALPAWPRPGGKAWPTAVEGRFACRTTRLAACAG